MPDFTFLGPPPVALGHALQLACTRWEGLKGEDQSPARAALAQVFPWASFCISGLCLGLWCDRLALIAAWLPLGYSSKTKMASPYFGPH